LSPFASGTAYATSAVVPTGRMVCDYIAAAMPGADIEWGPVIPQNFDNIFGAMNTLFQVGEGGVGEGFGTTPQGIVLNP
jgi:hypothetical protein